MRMAYEKRVPSKYNSYSFASGRSLVYKLNLKVKDGRAACHPSTHPPALPVVRHVCHCNTPSRPSVRLPLSGRPPVRPPAPAAPIWQTLSLAVQRGPRGGGGGGGSSVTWPSSPPPPPRLQFAPNANGKIQIRYARARLSGC